MEEGKALMSLYLLSLWCQSLQRTQKQRITFPGGGGGIIFILLGPYSNRAAEKYCSFFKRGEKIQTLPAMAIVQGKLCRD